MTDDEVKLRRQRELGTHAKQLREDKLLNSIFEGLKSQYMADWACTEPDNAAAREIEYMKLRALLDVRAQMNAIFSNGEAAIKFLADYEKRQQAA